jgi:cereblon
MQLAHHRTRLRGQRPPAPPDAPSVETDEVPTTQNEETWLCCRACSHRLARVSDRFAVPGHPEVASFVNPGGYVHEVLTLRAAPGCLCTGDRVRADSWFPGYTWRFGLCGGCGAFVGWYYEATGTAASAIFWGLRAPSVREG